MEPYREKRFPCTYCEKSFKDGHHLKRHHLTHTGEKPYSCDVCGKAFPRKDRLQKHQLIHVREERARPFTPHPPPPINLTHQLNTIALEAFQCGQSREAFLPNEILEVQLEENSSRERHFRCHVCGKSFNMRHRLTRHLQTHTGARPFACGECDKTFTRKEGLQKHQLKHLGEEGKCGETQDVKQPLPAVIPASAPPPHPTLLSHPTETPPPLPPPPDLLNVPKIEEPLAPKIQEPLVPKIEEPPTSSESGVDEEVGFRCRLCHKVFTQNYNLKRHMLTHTGEKLLSCEFCEKSFSRKEHLNKHLSTHTSRHGKHEVRMCADTAARVTHSVAHMARVAGTEHEFYCLLCSVMLRRLEDAQRHVWAHVEDRQCSCGECGKDGGGLRAAVFRQLEVQFQGRALMEVHMQEEETVAATTLPELEELFQNQPAGIQAHQMTFQEDGYLIKVDGLTVEAQAQPPQQESDAAASPAPVPQNTVTTPVATTNAGSFQMEAILKKTDPPVKKDLGSTLLPPPANNSRGERRGPEEMKKPFKCHVCSKGFRESHFLNRHLLSHTGEKPFTCPTCGKAFTRKDRLQNHQLSHLRDTLQAKVSEVRDCGLPDSPATAFCCCYCGKSYSSQDTLTLHMLESHSVASITSPDQPHHPEKFYCCSLCSKTFRQNYYLKRHMLTHTGERPYRCQVCEKTFIDKYNLNRHSVSHTGERSHICEFCDRGFIRKEQLRAHVMVHTGQKPHVCQFCQRGFIKKAHLQVHLRTHTGEKPYGCQVCGRAFSKMSNAKKHMAVHAKDMVGVVIG